MRDNISRFLRRLGVIWFRRDEWRPDCAPRTPVGLAKKQGKKVIANNDYAMAA